MANYSAFSNSSQTALEVDEEAADHTATFLVGFGVLMLFLVMGVAASAFLCVTLKKDPYLWPLEPATSTQGNQRYYAPGNLKCEEVVGLECSQI